MTLLARRFPRLSMLPHIPLAQTTPVQPLEELSDGRADLWVKRDDLTSELYGGNKVRKLEFLLGDARSHGCDTLVTAGAWGSHHVLATTLFGTKWGFEVHAAMMPQPLTPHVETNLRCALGAGLKAHPVGRWIAVPPTMAAMTASLRSAGERVYTVAYGGSSPMGALGFVEAGLELAAQIDAGLCPEPEAVYVALGSGGTAVGLALGLAAAGLTTKVVAVRVTPRIVCNQAVIALLLRSTLRKLRRTDPSFPAVGDAALGNLVIDDSLYVGYGEVDDVVRRAEAEAASANLELDPTYTARALAAMLRDARRGDRRRRLLFWLTLSGADLDRRLATAPALPPWTRKHRP